MREITCMSPGVFTKSLPAVEGDDEAYPAPEASSRLQSSDIWPMPKNRYSIEVVLCTAEEEAGEIPVFCPRLPNAISQGHGEKEALENITEALAGLIAHYQESGREIPWELEEQYSPEEGEVLKTVWVDVE